MCRNCRFLLDPPTSAKPMCRMTGKRAMEKCSAFKEVPYPPKQCSKCGSCDNFFKESKTSFKIYVCGLHKKKNGKPVNVKKTTTRCTSYVERKTDG